MAVILTSLLLKINKRGEGIPLYSSRGCQTLPPTLSGDGMGDRGGVISYASLITGLGRFKRKKGVLVLNLGAISLSQYFRLLYTREKEVRF